MIRVGLMSDLHMEFQRPEDRGLLLQRWLRPLEGTRVDMLLMPGDVDVGLAAIERADEAARMLRIPVFVTLGNHEFHHHDVDELVPAAKAAAARTDGRVQVLERDRADLDVRGARVAILGATLWTDYACAGDPMPAMSAAIAELADHQLIRHGAGGFKPKHARRTHRETREWLAREIPRARASADVVVSMTHHSPVTEANAPEHDRSRLTPAFVSDMSAEILDWQPDAWVFGHTHANYEGRIGRTALLSWQRGYRDDDVRGAGFRAMAFHLSDDKKRGEA